MFEISTELTIDIGDDDVLAHIIAAIETTKQAKPNDRSNKDRAYAITITELEKALAYFSIFAADDED